jgi:3-deoxy-D-arabino-heptulosonate 7-phosphate (DAHP) synthase class II
VRPPQGAHRRIAASARGEAFILQGGDCAETVDAVTTAAILNKLTTLLQMAAVLSHAASVPVVKIGRIAGQYSKPRSKGSRILSVLSPQSAWTPVASPTNGSGVGSRWSVCSTGLG